MAGNELKRITHSLTTVGYALTSYEEVGLEFDITLAKELSTSAINGTFSPDAAKITERIDKKKMIMVQDARSLALGKLMVVPVVEALFAHDTKALEDWELYAMNCYETGGELGAHKDSVEKTVLVVTASGIRKFDVYGRDESEDKGFTEAEQSFILDAGSIMILDAEADPGHSIRCIEGPSVSAVLDIPTVLRAN